MSSNESLPEFSVISTATPGKISIEVISTKKNNAAKKPAILFFKFPFTAHPHPHYE
jgi:hypothetical protein